MEIPDQIWGILGVAALCGVTKLVWDLTGWLGGPISIMGKDMDNTSLVYRRCPSCGITAEGDQLALIWGPDWESKTWCLDCDKKFIVRMAAARNEQRPMKRKVVIVYAPKLQGLPPKKIKEWYLPLEVRSQAKRLNYQFQGGYQTTVYLSDGYRFWRWNDWPWSLERPEDWDSFMRNNPEWEVLGEGSTTDEPVANPFASYVAC